jgi:hypothetical protein
MARTLADLLYDWKHAKTRADEAHEAAKALAVEANRREREVVKVMSARGLQAVTSGGSLYRLRQIEGLTVLSREQAPCPADLVPLETPCGADGPDVVSAHHRIGPDGRCLDCRAVLEIDVSDAEAAALVEELRRPALAEAVTEAFQPTRQP